MPKKQVVPQLKLHKATGQGYCRVNGQSKYLGKFGLPETDQAYKRFIAEWIANDRKTPVEIQDLTVVELCASYLKHAKSYYRKNGKPTGEVGGIKIALGYLKDHYGDTLVSEFTPRSLITLQALMIEKKLSRKYINKTCQRIKRVFKWGVSQMLVESSVYGALQVTEGLKKGRSDAVEKDPVKPAPENDIQAIKPFVSPQIWAMSQLQLLTAARPGEIVIMRPIDIDKSGDVWFYIPMDHKTSHHGKARRIAIGPKAQAIIQPFLKKRSEKSFLFSPKEAEAIRLAQQHKNRKTPLSCGNRPGSNRKDKRKKQPGDYYKVSSYRSAIQRACEKAGISKWCPLQLRHNAATTIRKEHGLEAAQVILGHSRADVTQIYAERNDALAAKVIGNFG